MNLGHESARTYRETSIKTANPIKLVVLLYDEAIYQIDTAIKSFEQGVSTYDKINNALGKAQDIVTELTVSLDMDQGDISQNLFRLYMYVNRVLSDTNLQKKSSEELLVCRDILQELRESWLTISENPPQMPISNNQPGGIDIAG